MTDFNGVARILGEKAVSFDGKVDYRVAIQPKEGSPFFVKSATSVAGYEGCTFIGKVHEVGEKLNINGEEVVLRRRTGVGDVIFNTRETILKGKAYMLEAEA